MLQKFFLMKFKKAVVISGKCFRNRAQQLNGLS